MKIFSLRKKRFDIFFFLILEFVMKMKKFHFINVLIVLVQLYIKIQLMIQNQIQFMILMSKSIVFFFYKLIKSLDIIKDIGAQHMFFKLNIPFKSFVVLNLNVVVHGVRIIFKYFHIDFFHHPYHFIVQNLVYV